MKVVHASFISALVVFGACAGQTHVMPLSVSHSTKPPFAAAALSSWVGCSDDPLLDRLTGLWTGTSPSGTIGLALMCRKEPDLGTVLFAVIPSGRFEGTATLAITAGRDALVGRYLRADADLHESQAVLTPIGADGIRLELNGEVLMFQGRRPLRSDRLTRTVIVGHRAASLGQSPLMNSLRAIRHARRLGADGVEIDITVPYQEGEAGKEPLTSGLRVHHPPEIRAEITGFDSVSVDKVASLPTVDEALEAARSSGLAMVYLDPKVKWLIERDRQAMRRALETLAASAAADAAKDRTRWIVIGAEDTSAGATGDTLADLTSDAQMGDNAAVNLAWAAEFTRGTNESNYLDAVTRTSRGPSPLLSFNLLRIDGGRGGVLGWLLRDLTPSGEAAIRITPHAKAYWTVHSRAQLQGVLRASERLGVGAADRAIIILTPYPHRLAYWLASTE